MTTETGENKGIVIVFTLLKPSECFPMEEA